MLTGGSAVSVGIPAVLLVVAGCWVALVTTGRGSTAGVIDVDAVGVLESVGRTGAGLGAAGLATGFVAGGGCKTTGAVAAGCTGEGAFGAGSDAGCDAGSDAGSDSSLGWVEGCAREVNVSRPTQQIHTLLGSGWMDPAACGAPRDSVAGGVLLV